MVFIALFKPSSTKMYKGVVVCQTPYKGRLDSLLIHVHVQRRAILFVSLIQCTSMTTMYVVWLYAKPLREAALTLFLDMYMCNVALS